LNGVFSFEFKWCPDREHLNTWFSRSSHVFDARNLPSLHQ